MCHNFLTISDPGTLGIGRDQCLTHWVRNWDPRLSATLEAMSQAGSLHAMTDLKCRSDQSLREAAAQV